MNFDQYKPFPAYGFGGQVDYQSPTNVVPGSAVKARNMSFDRHSARTRDGLVDTLFLERIDGSPIVGYDVLEVIGDVNPGQYPILFTEDGKLYLESPAGSGAIAPLATPFSLPPNGRMQTATAYNCLYMAFSDGIRGLCPPLRYNGLTQVVEPASQNPVGSRWVVGRFAEVGDVVTDQNSYWWRCTVAGRMGAEPAWPGQVGYFSSDGFQPAQAISDDTQWEEWTPGFEIYLPPPDLSIAVPLVIDGGGTISAGKDLYVRLAYVNAETGEGPWTDAIVFSNTTALSAVEIGFGTAVTIPATGGLTHAYLRRRAPFSGEVPAGGPPMPRWLAELNLRSDAFFPFQMNVYAAEVAHGSPAPSVYYFVATVDPIAPVVVSFDPATTVMQSNVSRPNTATSPDPAFSGTLAFNNPGYAYDMSMGTAAVGTGLSELVNMGGEQDPPFIPKTIQRQRSSSVLYTGFVAPPDTAHEISLLIDYAVAVSDPSNDVTAILEYSLDNGSAWLGALTLDATVQARTTFQLVLDPAQDYTHIKVRARVTAAPPSGGSTTVTLSLYDVRLGQTVGGGGRFTLGEILLRETAAAIALKEPPVFTGETGLRYAIVIRRDSTDSPSPVDPASPIPIMFTNGEPQRVAILPPGGPSTAELEAAFGVVGNGPAGPFFDIPVSSPVSPASSTILSIGRDGSGLVSATVVNALKFVAGHRVLVAGTGGDLDGSFAISNVDLSINQLQWGQDGAAASAVVGTVTEQQTNLRTAVDAPDNFFYVNFDDDFLSKARDDTALLTLAPAPEASDVSFIPTLRKMCYVDRLGRFHFSQTDDPGNIDSVGGVLLVEASAGGRGIAVREMTHGQIVAIKSNGGYQLNTSDVTPANWNPERLWELHGPPCAQLIAVGQDFLVFACEGGAYQFAGAALEWLSREWQGDGETGSWYDIDWKYGHRMWCAVDEDSKEIHFGVVTGDSNVSQ